MSTATSHGAMTDLTYGYYLLDGVIVNMDEEPVELPTGCNCDIDYLCAYPECIDNQMKMEAYYLCQQVPAEWVEFMESRKVSA